MAGDITYEFNRNATVGCYVNKRSGSQLLIDRMQLLLTVLRVLTCARPPDLREVNRVGAARIEITVFTIELQPEQACAWRGIFFAFLIVTEWFIVAITT